jgi:HK97 family phage portal protein
LLDVSRNKKTSMLSRLKSVFFNGVGPGNSQVAEVRKHFPVGNAANKPVTIDTALQLATVWACVRLLSETIATLPLFVYRKGTADSRIIDPQHPLYAILHDAPSADYTAVEFWEGVALSLCLWGNAYAKKEKMGGRLVALTPLRCDLMAVRRTERGAREYRYSDPKGFKVYSEDEIFHVRGFGGAGDVGLSPISFARQSLGNAMAADEFAGTMFANGARPSGILTIDQVLKPEQRKQLKENIVEPFVGSENAGGVMVFEAGMKFQPVTMTPEDSQFLETRGFHVEEICRWFRVPPFMVGHTEKTTSWGTGLEQQNIGFLTYSLRPYLTRIEQAIKRSLIKPEERSTVYAEFSVEGLLRADSKARAEFYAKALGAGGHRPWMTVAEVRSYENLPDKGGDTDTLQAPVNAIAKTPPDEDGGSGAPTAPS